MQEYNNPSSFLQCDVMMFSDIYVTAPNLDEARRIARTVIEERLGACANIYPITSIYRWHGSIEEDGECALLIKTKTELVDKLASRIRDLHSYETPCIVSFKIDAGDQSYLSWIQQETL